MILAGERLVDHPQAASAPFGWIFAAACVYAVLALLAANHPARPASARLVPRPARPGVHLGCSSTRPAGPFSQLRFAFFLVPLMAAAILTPRMTLLVSGLAVSAFATIAIVYPTAGLEGARTFELAQLAYLAVAALAAWLLAVVLERRRAGDRGAGREPAAAWSRRRSTRRTASAGAWPRRCTTRRCRACSPPARSWSPSPPDLARARAGIDRAVADLRSAIFDLHPHLLGEAGLGAALQAVADGHGRHGAPGRRGRRRGGGHRATTACCSRSRAS